jgi:HEAT repeat protein
MTEGNEQGLTQLADESRPVRSIDLRDLSDVPRERIEDFRALWEALSPERRVALLREMVEQAETHVDLNFHAVLRTLLDDPDAQVRRLAIEGLWEDEKTNLIAPLVAMLQGDLAPEVRAAAATSLGRYVWLGVMEEIAQRHADAAEEALREAWVRQGEVNEVRRRALESLAHKDTEGLNEMIRNAYYDEDELMRQSAIFAMGRTGDIRWSKLVMEETGSANPAMRFEAAQAAGEMTLKPAVQLLIRLVDDPDSIVREAAITALGKIGGTPARRALEFLARSEDEALAQAADDALAELRFISDVPEGAHTPARPARDDDFDDAADEDEYDDADYDDAFADGDEYEGYYDDDDDLDWDEDSDDEVEDGENETGYDDEDY